MIWSGHPNSFPCPRIDYIVIRQIPFTLQRVGLGTRLVEYVVNAESRGCCIADGNRGIPGEGHDITFSVPHSRSANHSFVPSESMALYSFQFWHVNLQTCIHTVDIEFVPNSVCLPLGWAWKEYYPSNSTVWSSQQVQWSNRESECYVCPAFDQYPMITVVTGVQDIQRVFCEEIWAHQTASIFNSCYKGIYIFGQIFCINFCLYAITHCAEVQ